MAEYANTVLACAGVLTIKQAAVVLWTVRARIMSGTINFKEEANNLFGPAFSVVLTSIPGRHQGDGRDLREDNPQQRHK